MVSYEDLSYTSKVHRGRHIERLSAAAYLRGLKTAVPSKARVLELGCGTGEALVPMALEYPEAQFFGIDSSLVAIDAAKALAERFHLKNLAFSVEDIRTFKTSDKFDFILCHGVYSWCDDLAREKILEIIGTSLAPNGTSLVSYNALPGGFFRSTVAQILAYYDRPMLPLSERAVHMRGVIERIIGSIDYDFEHPYKVMLHRELTRIQSEGEHYLFHEVLAQDTKPLLVSDFLKAAEKFGLQFLGDARFNRVSLNRLLIGENPSQGFQNVVQLNSDQIGIEQTMDFLFGTPFRETLLCRQAVELDSEVAIDRIKILAYAGHLSPDGEEVSYTDAEQEFYSPIGHILKTSKSLLKAALTVLHDQFPNFVVFNDLFKRSQALVTEAGGTLNEFDESVLAGALLEWMQRDAVSFSLYPSASAETVVEAPTAAPFARWQAQNKKPITNLFYETVEIESMEQKILVLCDGSNDATALVAEAEKIVSSGSGGIIEDGVAVTEPERIKELMGPLVESTLETLRCAGLLISK